MKALKGAVMFGQSGGPTSVINSSAAGVFTEALKNENITDKSLPIILINEGKIERTNFEKMQITFGELSKKLTPHLDNLKKITVLTMDEKGKIYLQKKGCKYQIFNIGANEKND